MSLSKQEFTNAGRNMLGRAQAGETLTITRIVVGSGAAAVPSDLWPLTALIHFELNVPIASKRDLGDGVLLVEGNFRSDDATAAFDLREVGIMAHIGSEADQLYSVANVFADPPNHIDPAAPVITAFKIKMIVDRISSDDIVVQIGPSEAILGENIGSDTDGKGVYKEAVGNVLYFKRVAAGDGIDITEDVDEELITISARQLKVDTDLYVPETYPGITDPNVLFPTVQAAHDYLLQFHIPANKVARINVYSGHFANSVPINFTHPDAVRIKVIGLGISSRTFRAATNITRAGTLPDLTLTMNLNDATGIAVNDIVFLHNAPHAQMEGCGRVQSIAGTTITVAMRIANVLPPSSVAPAAGTRLIVFPTQFTSTISTGTPIFNCPNGIGQIKNIGMRNASATPQQGQAVGILGGNTNSALEHVVVYNFSIGIGIAANTNLTAIVAANACSVGIQVGPAGTAYIMGANAVGGYNRLVWSGNVIYGLWVAGGSYVTAAPTGNGSITWACSNDTGIRSDTRAWVGMGDSSPGNQFGFVVGYNDSGCVAALMGIIQSALSTQSAIQANVTYDFRAAGGAQISVTHNVSMPPTGHFDPPNNVLGSDGAYISVASP